MGSHDWHDNPNTGRISKLLLYGRMFAKFIVLALFAFGVGQLGFILFQIVRLGLFS